MHPVSEPDIFGDQRADLKRMGIGLGHQTSSNQLGCLTPFAAYWVRRLLPEKLEGIRNLACTKKILIVSGEDDPPFALLCSVERATSPGFAGHGTDDRLMSGTRFSQEASL
jgi:hypothetical protein